MNRRKMVIAVLGILLTAGGVRASDTPKPDDGFVPMFDGKTLTGWENDRQLGC